MRYSSILASVLCVLATAPAALAQAGQAYTPPKTSWGAPDLQGFFSSASLTSMQRPAGATGLIVSQEERDKLHAGNIYTRVAKEEAGASQVETAKPVML